MPSATRPSPLRTIARIGRRALGDIDTAIPARFMGLEVPVIVEARHPDEPDLAVPEDRVLILPGESDIPLLLPPGDYRVEAFTKNGPVAGPVSIKVAAQKPD